MLPEVEAYFTALDKANEDYNTAYRKASDLYQLPDYPSWRATDDERQAYADVETKLYEAQRKLGSEIESTRRRIRDELAKSENPTVRFLATVAMREYPDHAETVLRLLPLSREELERVGPENDWCPEFARLYDAADEQDALPPYANPANNADINALVNNIRRNLGGRPMEVRTIIREHLPYIVANYLVNLDLTPLVDTLWAYEQETKADYAETIRKHLLLNLKTGK